MQSTPIIDRIYFDRIHIIEWLRPDDMRTGWELFGEIEPLGIASKPQVPVTFQAVSTRQAFVDQLREIERQEREHPSGSIIHIETHGDSDGIGTGDDDGLLWPELMRELVPINLASGLNLIVFLAACEGIWGIQMTQPVERAAYLGLIGPAAPIGAGSLARACVTFYRKILRDRDGVGVIEAMNLASGTPDLFLGVRAVDLFQLVWRNFMKGAGSEEQIFKRRAAESFHAGRPLKLAEEERLRARVRAQLRHFFEVMRREFFFIDTFPLNDARFPLRFEDCLPDSDS